MNAIDEQLAILAETFPQPPMTEQRLAAFQLALGDLTDAEVARATVTILRTRKGGFFPSPAEILEAARPTPTANALAPLFDRIEFEILLKRATLESIETKFGPAARVATVAAGGLPVFKGLDTPTDRVFALKRFTEAFQEAARDESLTAILGPADTRFAELAQGTAKVLSFPTAKERQLRKPGPA